jgi:flavin reductase
MNPHSEADFRAVMRQSVSAVCIVTARHPSGRQGLVATSIVSASMDPPTILFCVQKSSSFHRMVEMDRPFCVNFLSSEDAGLARHFGAAKGEERFSLGDWSSDGDGGPWLRSAQANVFGTVASVLDWHTHSIVCGRVLRTLSHAGSDSLLYANGVFLDATHFPGTAKCGPMHHHAGGAG